MNIQTGTNSITEILDNDLIYVGRPSAVAGQKDKTISGSNLKAQIQAVAVDNWSDPVTVLDANTELIALGAVASFTGFRVTFTINDGTYTTIGDIFITYSNSVARATPPNISYDEIGIEYGGAAGTLWIEQAAVSIGQMRWKITNNTGNTVTIKYKVEQFEV